MALGVLVATAIIILVLLKRALMFEAETFRHAKRSDANVSGGEIGGQQSRLTLAARLSFPMNHCFFRHVDYTSNIPSRFHTDVVLFPHSAPIGLDWSLPRMGR